MRVQRFNGKAPRCHEHNAAYGSWDFDEKAHVELDNELVANATTLLKRVRSLGGSPLTAAAVATAAVAAAEASGALPPLSTAQRNAFHAVLEELAAALSPDTEPTPESERTPEDDDVVDGAAAIKPLLRDIFAAVYNMKIHEARGGRGHTASPCDSIPAGGEQGNLALQATGPAGTVAAAPAESGTDRAEHAAEADFMAMEVGAFEAHAAPLPAEGGEREGLQGDAPSAGDGLQVAGDEQRRHHWGVWGPDADF